MNKEEPVISCSRLKKIYCDGSLKVDVFADIHLSIKQGAQIAIVGPSGAGKSTLLHLLGGLDKPTTGDVTICGRNIWQTSERERCQIRNQHLGFVYQFHHLLPEFTALENVMMPLLIGGSKVSDAKESAHEYLKDVGLTARTQHKPSQLSGGERQRVAIARALVNSPKCVLADEPTGNLDENTASQVFDLFLSLNEQYATAFVIVTHNLSLAKKMKEVIHLTPKGLESNFSLSV